MAVSQRIGAPARSAPRAAAQKPGEAATSPTRSTIPQAWIIRTTTRRERGLEAVEVGLAADHRERAAVDLGAVADVVGSRRRRPTRRCCARISAAAPQRRSQRRPSARSASEPVAHGCARRVAASAHVEQRLASRRPARRTPTGPSSRSPARRRARPPRARRERARRRAASTSRSVSVRQGERRSSPSPRAASARSAASEPGSSRASGGSAVTATRPSLWTSDARARAAGGAARRLRGDGAPAEQRRDRARRRPSRSAIRHGRPPAAAASSRKARAASQGERRRRRSASAADARARTRERERERRPSRSATSATSARAPSARPLPSSTANRKRPGSAAKRRVGAEPAVELGHDRVGRGERRGMPPGERAREHVAHELVLGRRQQPGVRRAARRPARPRRAGSPRICRFAREVSSTIPLPRRAAARDRRRADAREMRPPGRRTRASPPSSAACSVNTPGQRSAPARRACVLWSSCRHAARPGPVATLSRTRPPARRASAAAG